MTHHTSRTQRAVHGGTTATGTPSRRLAVRTVGVVVAVALLLTVAVGVGVATGPAPVDLADLAGDGTENNPYQIANVSQLQAMEQDLSAHYRLNSSFSASETEGWNGGEGFDPIGPDLNNPFTGHFDGAGHTISDLYIDRDENDVGLFGVVRNDGTVENVGLEHISVKGDDRVGGLVGQNSGAGTTVSESYATGSVNGNARVGGLIGENLRGTVSESYATGSVTGSGNNVGGLVGRGSISVTNSYWDTETTTQSTSAGGTGFSTAQMTGLNATETENMGAFDFDSIWTATDSYPLLQWSVDDLNLTLADDELTEGETTDATVTVTTADGRSIGATTTSSYIFSPAGVASVDAAGTVSADNEGSTTITAKLIELTDSFSLSVLAQPASSGGSGGSGGSSGSGTTPPAEEADEEEPAEPEVEPETVDTEPEADDEPQPETDETDEQTPGFGLLVGLVALLSIALWARRRSA